MGRSGETTFERGVFVYTMMTHAVSSEELLRYYEHDQIYPFKSKRVVTYISISADRNIQRPEFAESGNPLIIETLRIDFPINGRIANFPLSSATHNSSQFV